MLTVNYKTAKTLFPELAVPAMLRIALQAGRRVTFWLNEALRLYSGTIRNLSFIIHRC